MSEPNDKLNILVDALVDLEANHAPHYVQPFVEDNRERLMPLMDAVEEHMGHELSLAEITCVCLTCGCGPTAFFTDSEKEEIMNYLQVGPGETMQYHAIASQLIQLSQGVPQLPKEMIADQIKRDATQDEIRERVLKARKEAAVKYKVVDLGAIVIDRTTTPTTYRLPDGTPASLEEVNKYIEGTK